MDGCHIPLVDERHTEIAGLRTCVVGALPAARLTVVLLHGYSMSAGDFAPFAHSMAMPGVAYAFPQAPLAAGNGYSWWPAQKKQGTSAHHGACDLAAERPAGRAHARGQVRDLLAALRTQTAGEIILGGFSQGGMLAADTALLEPVEIDGLAMMSASCIALDEWRVRAARLLGLRSFVSHGRADPDLAFSAGQRLEHFLSTSGACTTWVPFDGRHEIPFRVWRQFRHFLAAAPTNAATGQTIRYGTH